MSANENPFVIGSPKFVEWRKARQASFQERVIGMGLAHVSLQTKASRATMIRRAAQLRGNESGAARLGVGFGGPRSYDSAVTVGTTIKTRAYPAEV